MKSSIIKTGTMLAGFLLAACLSTHAEDTDGYSNASLTIFQGQNG